LSLDQLVGKFLKKGGKVNKFYLQSWNKNKRSLVYLNGWFSGKNIREAIMKALS
jgi:hypothetical protein